ncbi:hypothetical protein CK227_10380 [Mesorhizobium sp. WSM4308]|uniref:hypothetical protein n=1 Tax=Mesorhizobium sp. WSM4308 TaxID=2029409 RepID=UPI000BAFEC7E|nr:hypothetical protein [Mesorhizobium sp. WSM4308]PBB75189.1 hypothetical protein CK227_10380 [Mesorhizobium sp. WSM4308]
MSERIPHDHMAHALDLMVAAKVNWLSRFSDGKQKRPDHEIDLKRRDIEVLRQAAADYRAAASRDARAA